MNEATTNQVTRRGYWYEYRGPSKWVRHKMVQDPDQYGGACSVDFNGDGYPDIVTANIWINDLRNDRWPFVRSGLSSGAHDSVAADINGDQKKDIVAFTQEEGLNWFSFSKDPTKPWTAHPIAPLDYAGGKVHATGSPSGVPIWMATAMWTSRRSAVGSRTRIARGRNGTTRSMACSQA